MNGYCSVRKCLKKIHKLLVSWYFGIGLRLIGLEMSRGYDIMEIGFNWLENKTREGRFHSDLQTGKWYW